MKKTIIILMITALIILIAGIYKFNFTNQDIYVKDKEGKAVPIDLVKTNYIGKKINSKALQTKTGKTIIITETHPIGESLSSVVIKTKGFETNKTIELTDIDPIEKIALYDLDNDGFDEIYLLTRSTGPGFGGDFHVYASDKDQQLIKCSKEKLNDIEYLEGGKLEGYIGNNTYCFDYKTLVDQFPIYNENDSNSNPKKGTKKIHYSLNQFNFKILKIETIN